MQEPTATLLLSNPYVWLISVISIGAGAFLGAYLKKKGENLATHEDITKLVDQVKAVTKATKEIESKIEDQVWNRQRQWELKRDILFDATKVLSDVDSKLLSLSIFWQHKLDDSEIKSEESEVTLQNNYVTAWQTSMRSFEEVEALTQVTCSIETMRAFTHLGSLLRETAAKIVKGDTLVYGTAQKEREKRFGLAKLAIRKELGIATSVMPLTSVSSATPPPE